MRTLLVRLFVNAVALWGAARVVEGVALSERPGAILLVAFLFGLVNALIKPVVALVTLPLRILTLGLITLVINAGMLLLTAALTPHLTVVGFWAALLGSVVISGVSFLLSLFLTGEKKRA